MIVSHILCILISISFTPANPRPKRVLLDSDPVNVELTEVHWPHCHVHEISL